MVYEGISYFNVVAFFREFIERMNFSDALKHAFCGIQGAKHFSLIFSNHIQPASRRTNVN